MASKDSSKAAKGEEEKAEFPDFPDLKPDEIKTMSHEEKLKLIEREAQTLYDFCVEKGLSRKDLSWCLKPLFGSPPELVKKTVKDNSKFFMTFAVIGFMLAVIFGWSTAYNLVCVHGKLALMKVLFCYSHDIFIITTQHCTPSESSFSPFRSMPTVDPIHSPMGDSSPSAQVLVAC